MDWTKYFKLYKFLPGRIVVMLLKMAQVAESLQNEALASHCKSAIEIARKAFGMKSIYKRQPRTTRNPEGTGNIDRRFGQWCKQCDALLKSMSLAFEKRPIGMAAQKLLTAFFPKGIGVVVNDTYENELVVAEHLLYCIDQSLAAEWAKIPTEDLRDRLFEIVTEFREAMQASPNLLKSETVKAAQADAQKALFRVICACILAYSNGESEDNAALQKLFAPIEAQSARVRKLRQKKTAPTDVDPESGEELVEDSDPGDLDEDPDAPESDA